MKFTENELNTNYAFDYALSNALHKIFFEKMLVNLESLYNQKTGFRRSAGTVSDVCLVLYDIAKVCFVCREHSNMKTTI